MAANAPKIKPTKDNIGLGQLQNTNPPISAPTNKPRIEPPTKLFNLDFVYIYLSYKTSKIE